MRKAEAITIVKEAFDSKFDENSFKIFIANLLKKYTAVYKTREGPYIREAFQQFVSKYNIIGEFNDNAGNKIHVLQVFLHKETSLFRARTAQRNFVADYLKNNSIEAALVAFIAVEEDTDWRFSLVKLEYSLDVKDGKTKTNEELTPAKRWSFLVGKHEGSHTAQSRFVPLLEDDQEPNLSELEGAFNIEKVTNEFFEKYCDLFLRMKESLDKLLENDAALKTEFDVKEISTVDFAKKTLGQMAFLYFLQKKGWFGVHPNKEWGSGVKNFLRELFDARKKYGENFFDEVLEPLFYEALAQDRGKEAIYPKLNNCRMPFLNGGLFEPMNGYSWETTHICLSDDLFSNAIKDPKTGDIGNGILDVFDRYNFTVNENEPLEKEVAVDPEMLGKVFENLLEIRDRKSKGAFYTPREIVHYMCQESLINYLNSETGETIPREDIEMLIKSGVQIIQYDQIVLKRGKENLTYKFMLPESIRDSAKKLDSLLENIKVCDPAVGSGAFPLGMLNEIVRARQVLAVHLGTFDQKDLSYKLKLHTISHSIYGVDIDSGAVEIAKLRLWLALVVEEENPHPLPNLEHKIMQGNSLISEYEGIKLFDDSFLTNVNDADIEKNIITERLSKLQKEYFDLHSQNQLTPVAKVQIESEIRQLHKRIENLEKKKEINGETIGLFDTPAKQKIAHEKTETLQKKIEQFISESRKTQKQDLKEEIDALKWELIEATLEEQGRMDKLADVRSLRRKNIRPFFIWKLEFSEVFKGKGGFDVIIANPPYVGESKNKEIFRPIAQGNLGKFYLGKMDLFYFFFHLAIELGKNKSQCAFITTNYYITAFGAKKLRRDLKERASIRNVINFNELRIFETALGQHNMITIFSKENNNAVLAQTCITQRKGTANERILSSIVGRNDQETSYNQVAQNDLYDGEDNYIRILGANNSIDPIQLILYKVQKNGDLLGSLCNINQGVVSGCDYVSGKNIEKLDNRDNIEKYDGIFVFDLENHRDVDAIKMFSDEERQLLRPFFKNSEISRYWCATQPTKLLLYFENQLDEKKFGNLSNHLKKFYGILNSRLQAYNEHYHWTSLHRGRSEKIFLGNKIVVPYRSTQNVFALNNQEWFCRSDCYVITEKNKECDLRYVLALLNSSLYFQWLYHRGKRKGEILELFQAPLSEIPIKKILPELQKPFIELVDQILAITSASGYDPKKIPISQKELEGKIDEMVFDLYELTPEERDTVLKI